MINAPASRIWELIRDFNALPSWHPGIAESRIEGNSPADQVSCVRTFCLKDGGYILERLLALSDFDFSCTYSILESPMPLRNDVSTLKLTSVIDGDRTFAEWSAEFECEKDQERKLITTIGQGVFQGGFDALKTLFTH